MLGAGALLCTMRALARPSACEKCPAKIVPAPSQRRPGTVQKSSTAIAVVCAARSPDSCPPCAWSTRVTEAASCPQSAVGKVSPPLWRSRVRAAGARDACAFKGQSRHAPKSTPWRLAQATQNFRQNRPLALIQQALVAHFLIACWRALWNNVVAATRWAQAPRHRQCLHRARSAHRPVPPAGRSALPGAGRG